jgi:hypothetical protein
MQETNTTNANATMQAQTIAPNQFEYARKWMTRNPGKWYCHWWLEVTHVHKEVCTPGVYFQHVRGQWPLGYKAEFFFRWNGPQQLKLPAFFNQHKMQQTKLFDSERELCSAIENVVNMLKYHPDWRDIMHYTCQ